MRILSQILHRVLPILIGVATACSLGCDIPFFEHPLVDPDQADLPTELLGIFEFQADASPAKSNSDVPETIKIAKAGNGFPDGFISVEFASMANGVAKLDEYIGFTFKIDDLHFCHLPIHSEDPAQPHVNAEDWKAGKYTGFHILAFDARNDQLRMLLPNYEFLKEEVRAGNLPGVPGISKIKSDDVKQDADPTEPQTETTRVTASTDVLLEFFRKNADKLIDQSEPHYVWSRLKE